MMAQFHELMFCLACDTFKDRRATTLQVYMNKTLVAHAPEQLLENDNEHKNACLRSVTILPMRISPYNFVI